jgi:glycosyltransferase involved in cell wall biosynthesis
MRVAIDLLMAEKEPGGMLFACRALLAGLARIDSAHEYIIITARPRAYEALLAAPNIRLHAVRLLCWRGLLVQHQLILPEILRHLKPDVLHVPAFVAPIGWHGPLVITVHDLAFLESSQHIPLHIRLYWQALLHESVRRAQCIIAISEQTRSELMTSWKVEAERIALIHNAVRPSLPSRHVHPLHVQAMQQRYGPRYLLHVGRIVPHKNVETLIAAFDAVAERFPDLHLVLTGGYGYGSATVLQRIANSPHRERIHQAGWVSDYNLGVLYTGACALVFPSQHEGFGLPTLEAMAFNTPVVASFGAASFEIAGDAVLRADCSSPESLADALSCILTDSALQERLITLGQKQVQSFTVEACAHATCRIYERALLLSKIPV